MTTPNLDVALRVKADLDSGRAGVQGLNQDLANTGKAADSSNAALGRSSQRMDALLASTNQVVEILQRMEARQDTLAAQTVQLAQATAQVEVATSATAAIIGQLGESEEQAAARIKGAVAASLEQVAAQKAATAAMEESAASARSRGEQADQVSAAIGRQTAQTQRWADADRQAEASQRSSIAATQDRSAELSKLVGQIDPTIAALERLDQQEQQLKSFRGAGLDDASYQHFQQQIDNSRKALDGMGVSAGQTKQALRQLPAQITDVTVSLASGMPVWLVFLQQGGQIKDSFGGVGNAIGAVTALLTPMRIAIGATVGVLGLLAAAAIQGYREEEQLNNALIATGNYAGASASQLRAIRDEIGQTTGRYSDAQDAITALTASGKLSGDTLTVASRAAVDFSKVTGKSIDDAVSAILRLADDPVRATQQLDQQYHFLTTTQFQQIEQLQQEGNAVQAVSVAYNALADTMSGRAGTIQANLGYVERTWNFVKEASAYYKNQVLSIGAPASDDDKLAELQRNANTWARQITALQSQRQVSTGIGLIDDLAASSAAKQLQHAQEEYAKAATAYRAEEQRQAKAEQDRNAAATAAQVQAEGKTAAASIDQLTSSLDKAKQRQDALNKASSELYKIHLAGGKLPDGINFDGAAADKPQGPGWDKLVAEINKRYADPKGPKSDNREAIAAQQQLIQSLQQLQGELDPTAAAWAKYYQAVERANEEADKAKKDPNANAASIDAQRNAIVSLAAAVRDADIQKVADKNREAWEKLLGTLGTPAEVKVGKAVEDIKQLNTLMASGTGNADQYKAALDNIGKNSVLALPSYQGVDAAVGGVSSELTKNFKAQADLDKWHQQALAANEAFRQGDTANEEAYQAGLAQIRSQYAQRSTQIESDRQQLQLTTTSNLFGQLSVLQQSNNRKIAAIGKAAAITKTIIDTYQSATSAYASLSGIPVIGPALGAAAAAAAIAAGLANVAQIRSQNTSFAGGGQIRGPGTKTSDSVPIWASDGEFMQRAAAVDYYGVDFMHAVNNLEYPRGAFADGGLINPFSDAPRLAMSSAPSAPRMNAVGSSSVVNNRMRVYYVANEDELRQRIIEHPSTEKAVVLYASQNGNKIKAEW